MADRNNRLAQNVPGLLYVDATCVDCDICRHAAPQFLKRDDDAGVSFVYRQPVTPRELSEAAAAALCCPTDSIGIDG